MAASVLTACLGLLAPAVAEAKAKQAAHTQVARTPGVRKSAQAAAKPAHVAQRGTAARAARPHLPLIVIDPGHGGRDGGAVGVTGLLEKDVTLATALELRRQLLAGGRFRVELTRSTNIAVSLQARAARAQAGQAALFISIHADASSDSHARGASVYVRADAAGGARITRLPANSANAGAIGHALSDTGQPRPFGSALLQNIMVGQLRDDVVMVADPARQAHLFVLGTVGVPSVLVEMGFMSNRQEEQRLRSPRYRQTISTALRDGILDYFKEIAKAPAHRT